MRFSVVKINTVPCFLNGVGIAVSVFSYQIQQTRPYLFNDFTDGALPNGTKVSTVIEYCKCSAHVSKDLFHGNFAFSSIQTVHVFTKSK